MIRKAVVVAAVSAICGWAYVRLLHGTHAPVVPVPAILEPTPGTNQCNYELLRAFAVWMREQDALGQGLRYTIGAGTLLGAMRTLHFTQRAGLLPWEADVDVYMPAADAFAFVERLHRVCSSETTLGGGRWPEVCDTVEFRGFVDASGGPCCGFGFKLYHRARRECEMDILVLAASGAPMLHGETPWWPPFSTTQAMLWSWIMPLVHNDTFYVIPEDVYGKVLMRDRGRWRSHAADSNVDTPVATDLAWSGVQLSFFHSEYFRAHELFPLGTLTMYDFEVRIPHDPWASLERTYGPHCRYVARLSVHDCIEVDLRLPEYASLVEPAKVQLHRADSP